MTNAQPVDLDEAFGRFTEVWSPRIIGRVNDYDVKIAAADGEFPAHAHAETDEFFLVLAGRLTLDLPERGREVVLAAGSVWTVPRGVRHRPVAAPGTRLLLFEPRGTVNTGDAGVAGTEGAPLPPG